MAEPTQAGQGMAPGGPPAGPTPGGAPGGAPAAGGGGNPGNLVIQALQTLMQFVAALKQRGDPKAGPAEAALKALVAALQGGQGHGAAAGNQPNPAQRQMPMNAASGATPVM